MYTTSSRSRMPEPPSAWNGTSQSVQLRRCGVSNACDAVETLLWGYATPMRSLSFDEPDKTGKAKLVYSRGLSRAAKLDN